VPTQESKKICILLPSFKFGGAERVALNLARALEDSGVRVVFLLMSREGELLCEAERDFPVIDLRCDRTYKLPFKLLSYFVRQRPDVLISSFWKLNLCSCLARIRFPSIRLLLWEHSQPSKSRNSPKWLYAISASILYRFADTVVTVSSAVYADVDRWTRGLRGRLVTIFNPIQPPDPGLLHRRKRAPGRQIVWVGRLDTRKNPVLALEAFAVAADACDADLIFVGEGPMRRELEQRRGALGLEHRVSFTGYLANPYEVIAVSDLLLLSSENEGLPSVVIEAMYCGLRVVSTDCGTGVHDILLDNVYGTIVTSNDKVALARAIEAELASRWVPQFQIDGAQRFLPHVAAQQFLLAVR
jgi:glycosyltransferase involved in cell wall biosynthesis